MLQMQSTRVQRIHSSSSRFAARRHPVVCFKHYRPQRMASQSVGAASSMPAEQTDGKLTREQWSEYQQRWSTIWDSLKPGELPAFDKGGCSPQLLRLLDEGSLTVTGRRVLVPGCGRGYDVMAFAAAGASLSVGVEICPLAVAAAAAQRDKELGSNPAAAAACELVVGDFFNYTHTDGLKFDVGYDYTFLCALHPDMRDAWAQGWARLLNPGGDLITMIYPVDSSMDQKPGPPWPVTPQLYQQLLLPAGFELVSVSQIPLELSHPSRSGREWLGRWKRTAQS